MKFRAELFHVIPFDNRPTSGPANMAPSRDAVPDDAHQDAHQDALLRTFPRAFRRTAAACAIALCATLAAPGNLSAQVNAEQVMNIGRNVMSMEDYLLAIQYFNLAIKSKPYLADAYFLRGLAKLQLDDYDGAVADCNLALERNKYKSEAYKVRGFALMNLQKDSLAVEDFNRGLEYNPNDRYFLFYKGVAQSELKQFDDADSTFRLLLRRHPKMEDAWMARGRLNLLRGDTIAAIEDINHSLRLSKSLLNAHLMKADIAAQRHEWKESLESMDEAIRLRPDESDFYVNRAYLRYNNEDFFGAMADYNYALQLDPSNTAALFNRALLRSEVKELSNAEADFTQVLAADPKNFYALYNRGLIRLELGDARHAIADFREIARRYPRFHPAYYAIAECCRQLGQIQEMVNNIKKGDALVANYVANPSKNPLDRPTISPGKSNSRRSAGQGADQEETAEEFMERFNQLMTSADVNETQLSFNDRIKGRVQDRNINVRPEGAYALSFDAPEAGLRNISNYFRDLDNLNRRQYISRKVYLTSGDPAPADAEAIQRLFSVEEEFGREIAKRQPPRPIDLLGRGVARTMLRNYDGAISDLTQAIAGSDDFATAIFARAYALYCRSHHPSADGEETISMEAATDLRQAMTDLDAVLAISPEMIYAWFNKGIIYYESSDFTSAIQCFSQALALNPEFGQAYYNRGLAYMQQGNRDAAFADLSKAGELGVLPSYNILKRMK